MKNGRRIIVVCVMAGVLACLTAGCGDAQQRSEQKKELPDLTGTIDGSAPGDSAGTGSAASAYTINGKRVQLGEPGADGKVSFLTSVSGALNGDGLDDLSTFETDADGWGFLCRSADRHLHEGGWPIGAGRDTYG